MSPFTDVPRAASQAAVMSRKRPGSAVLAQVGCDAVKRLEAGKRLGCEAALPSRVKSSRGGMGRSQARDTSGCDSEADCSMEDWRFTSAEGGLAGIKLGTR